MADVSSGIAKEFLNKFAPSDEQRSAFNNSFLGRLLGQSVLLVLNVGIYIAAFVVIHEYAWATFSKFSTIWLVVFMTVPIMVILLFSFLPLAWRAVREHRLRVQALGGAQFKPGYFRLFPYGVDDRQTYKRLDGAAEEITGWLRSRPESLLYFSGASGSGKSSLLAAYALPALRDAGWSIVEVRLLDDAVEQLREAIVSDTRLFARRPADSLPLRTLLERAAAGSLSKDGKPLMVMIDQFEEFLILRRPDEQQPFLTLLEGLVRQPITGLKLLLVFRSDYYELVFKLGLPDAVPRQNWWTIAPYGRSEAMQFLKEGGRELSEQSLESLFSGLDRIEETPGLYRPITLNMVGLVLDSMGPRIEGDPGRLVQAYLVASINQKEIRDYTPAVLSELISDSGTRHPQTAEKIAERTGLNLWQVKATLTILAERGLVRSITYGQTIWEISHDFLARVLGQIIGRLKRPLMPKVLLAAAPVVLLSWVALAAIAVPYWDMKQDREAEAELRSTYGATIGAHDDALAVTFLDLRKSRDLNGIADRLKRLTAVRTIVLNAAGLTTLLPLRDLDNLQQLVLGLPDPTTNGPILDVSEIAKLPSITKVQLQTHIPDNKVDITFLRDMPQLKELYISKGTIPTLEPLRRHPGIEAITFADLKVDDVGPLLDVPNLKTLVFIRIGEPMGLNALKERFPKAVFR